MKFLSYRDFSYIIKYKRIDLNYQQKDIAFYLTISKSKYCKIENGLQEPTFIELQMICYILDLDFNKLVLKK